MSLEFKSAVDAPGLESVSALTAPDTTARVRSAMGHVTLTDFYLPSKQGDPKHYRLTSVHGKTTPSRHALEELTTLEDGQIGFRGITDPDIIAKVAEYGVPFNPATHEVSPAFNEHGKSVEQITRQRIGIGNLTARLALKLGLTPRVSSTFAPGRNLVTPSLYGASRW